MPRVEQLGHDDGEEDESLEELKDLWRERIGRREDGPYPADPKTAALQDAERLAKLQRDFEGSPPGQIKAIQRLDRVLPVVSIGELKVPFRHRVVRFFVKHIKDLLKRE